MLLPHGFLPHPRPIFSSPEHKVLMVTFCDRPMSVIRRVPPVVHNFFNPFPNKPWFFTCLQYKPFENTAGKGVIARNEQFLLFLPCFLRVSKTFCHFHRLWNCRLQTLSVWKSLKFVIWERVKYLLLLNHWANLDETWQGCSLGEAVPKLYKRLNSSHKCGCHGIQKEKNSKIFENLVLRN